MLRFLTVCLFSAACTFAQNAPVPVQYQDIFTNLSSQISAFDASVHAGWSGARSPLLYSPQLEAANSTSFTSLLGTNYYAYNLAPELEELQALGATAVTVHINFPVLYQPFYSQNPAQYQQFVSFYQQVASDVRARGMKLIVEAVVGVPFAGNEAGSFDSYLKSLSWPEYMAGRAQNALNVAQLIQPDYMSVITEPDTEAGSAYQPNAGTVSGSTQLLQTILAALIDDSAPQVLVGAGTGSWIAGFSQYVQNFTALPIDYYDFHIYPINNNDLMNVLSAADTIHAAGKQVSISEAWEYKVSNAELGKLSVTAIYARDPFSFWIPVDIAFLQALSDFANYKQLLFLSPYWSHYLSAYLDYSKYGLKSNNAVLTDSDSAAYNAVLAGTFTPTGLAWEQLAIPAPDSTPPAAPSAPFATAIYPTSVQLAWAAATDNVGVAAYRLYRNGSLLTATSMLSYNDVHLTKGTTYAYTLSASDASANTSGLSLPLVVTTTDTNPPSVPKDLKLAASSPTSVSLIWDPSTPAGSVAGYNILRGASRNSLARYATSVTNSFTDATTLPATTYYYAVESFNLQQVPSDPGKTLRVETPTQ